MTATSTDRPLPFLGDLDLIPPENEARAVLERTAQWESALRPWDLVECWHSQHIARETIRLQRLHQAEIVLRHDLAIRAGISWHEDRLDDAETLAAGLSRHPAKVLAELRRSPQGCHAIVRRWDILLATLDARGAWSAAERLMALNLLNVPPELRESVTPLDAPAGADPIPHLRALAVAQIRRHHDLAAALAPVDALAREAQRQGLGPDTPALEGLRKEERAADRRLAWCRSQFKSGRRAPRPPDSDNRPPYTFTLSDKPYQSDEADAPAPDLESAAPSGSAPRSSADSSLPDPSAPRGSPTTKSRRRRRRA